MVTNLLFPTKFAFYSYLSVFILFYCSIDVNAQCAGNDNVIEVCDIPNASSQSINLFNQLLGSPTAGGTWTDDDHSEGLDTATGILNAQLIKSSGIYTYTYTVNNIAGCTDNSATITVTIGGYSGVGSIGNVCKDDTAFNLFQVFDSRTLDPQINGTWLDDDLTGAISNNILNATTLVVNQTYHFTYKMSTIGGCSEKSTTVQVVIKQPVYSGIPTNLKLCSGQLSSYTSYNLNDSLGGEDPNGTWAESGTNEITGPTDSTIDIQNIYNTHGLGIYSFAYTVLSKNLICPSKSSTVVITIEKQLLDVSNLSVIVKDACLNQPASVELSGLGSLNNITLSYDLTGVNNANNQVVNLDVRSGFATFSIPSTSIPNLGVTSFSVTNLTSTGNDCPAIIPPNSNNFTVNAIPNVPIAIDQPFCKTDNPMVSNLEPSGNQYKWFNSATSTTALNNSALLVTGNYWVRGVDAATGCKSESKKIGVAVNEIPTPVLKQDGEKFCGIDNPTIQNLTANVTPSATIAWFDSPTNGNQFANTELLTEGTTYFGFDYSSATNCFSSVLPVTVSLKNCDETPDFFIPDGFSPNGDNVNETFRILDIEFIYPNYSLEIFNRYGNLMFNGNINKPAWDGKNSNSSFIDGDSPTGVYFYIINYNKDNLAPRQGQLYLNR
jgi:gliding motility-associated-like protein